MAAVGMRHSTHCLWEYHTPTKKWMPVGEVCTWLTEACTLLCIIKLCHNSTDYGHLFHFDCRLTVVMSWRPGSDFCKPQHIHNNWARVVCQSQGCTDARPLLRSLHWFPVRQRVTHALRHISAIWYRPMHHLRLCTHPMLHCWWLLVRMPKCPIALSLLLLHPH